MVYILVVKITGFRRVKRIQKKSLQKYPPKYNPVYYSTY